ncbi:Hint domain-containing protein [Tateyamaria sp. ANG-S1]|uniref:Hint domain-containing protein n=1 Tax=Tateyamaria sp. ANG-S1 TaxID=1577905 RepID=UPI00057E8306|nr:Hint domain-containing protein [Tateyamaria sp. ANG-S1]KIC51491.1 hemolysin-type calcium-binding protein [Tateyamaria sp. ANG-S1]
MKTGFRGTFVISWTQTEVDGLDAAPIGSLAVGAAWAWRGDPVQVDGPQDVLRLDRANGEEDIRRRAARMVHRLVGAALHDLPLTTDVAEPDMLMFDSSFVVTDGAKSYTVTVIDVGGDAPPLLMFVDDIPPRKTDLWVVHHTIEQGATAATPEQSSGVICFTPGTLIDTPDGPRLIEALREGDRVQTMDNGAQEILWVGSRRMTGARLFALPQLRPVRIATGALGIEQPGQELLVSPEHRMLVKGDVARDLFNTPEVLVAAKDLVNGTTITVDLKARSATYVHLLLPQHEVLRANGVETESFHPANTAFSMLSAADRARLVSAMPNLEQDPHTYGDYARRNLSPSEAAILNHAA